MALETLTPQSHWCGLIIIIIILIKKHKRNKLHKHLKKCYLLVYIISKIEMDVSFSHSLIWNSDILKAMLKQVKLCFRQRETAEGFQFYLLCLLQFPFCLHSLLLHLPQVIWLACIMTASPWLTLAFLFRR